MFLFSEFYKFMGDIDRQSILLSPNFPGPHEFHNFMGKVRSRQNTFPFRVSYIYFISMLRVAGGECHISVFSKIMNFHWVLSLLSTYTPHSYQHIPLNTILIYIISPLHQNGGPQKLCAGTANGKGHPHFV